MFLAGIQDGTARTSIAAPMDNEKGITRMGNRLILLAIAVLLLFGAIVSSASASSISCSGGNVYTGDLRMDLISKCGNPDDIEYGYDTTGATGGNGNFTAQSRSVQKFYYNCGAGRLSRIITISDGRVIRIITTGNYGSGPNKCE